jgi:hypothetical protein
LLLPFTYWRSLATGHLLEIVQGFAIEIPFIVGNDNKSPKAVFPWKLQSSSGWRIGLNQQRTR